ncbi:hypothetical protein JW898_00995 [Candidatus Woesearchaeota archaeon]|nr:hypothetical protein [Candidatus Woesearchaeota archaeon]
MAGKEVRAVFVLLSLVILVFAVSGCWKKTEVIVCEPPMTIIGERCCLDNDIDYVCDDLETAETANATGVTPGVCGNGVCENETENCTTCWQDCGACKKIVYIYYPRNFTLADITYDLNVLTRDGIKFRKDINALNNVSNLFYFDRTIPRYFADIMGTKYKPLHVSRMVLLNNIVLEEYYINSSAALFDYVNFSNWYIVHRIRNAEMTKYETRISSDKAKDDYPTQPTGYQKQLRYADWEFRNYTKNEEVLFDNVTLLDNSMVESLYASMTDFNITYKYHEYADRDKDVAPIYAYKDVGERRLSYVHALSFTCARNLAITIYDYDFDSEYCTINPECILAQVRTNRASLMSRAGSIRQLCDSKYSNKVFIYT